MKTQTMLAALAAWALAPGPARAETIDFEALAFDGPGAAILGESYAEDGFTLVAEPSALGVHGRQSAGFAGSTAIFDSGGTTLLARDDGQAFAVQTVALARHAGEGPARVDVWGWLRNGDVAVQTFVVGGGDGFATYAFNAPFDAVLAVAFERNVTAQATGYQVDDIVLAAPVPLPASLPLLVGAFGAAALAGWTGGRGRRR